MVWKRAWTVLLITLLLCVAQTAVACDASCHLRGMEGTHHFTASSRCSMLQHRHTAACGSKMHWQIATAPQDRFDPVPPNHVALAGPMFSLSCEAGASAAFVRRKPPQRNSSAFNPLMVSLTV
jgi:hypothetical protein